MPLVALIGPSTADQIESGINAVLAARGVGLCWWLMGRIGVERLIDRFWLTILFGFSTQILWVTTRGGVWHTGQLIATILTFACLIELWGKRRAWLIGLLAGAAFLTRAPLAFAIPFYALMLDAARHGPDSSAPGRTSARRVETRGGWIGWRSACCRRSSFFFSYNRSGSGRRSSPGTRWRRCPPSSRCSGSIGLFSLAHIPMNLDYFLLHLPTLIPDPPFFQPDGLGMSVFITSPGCCSPSAGRLARAATWWLAGAAIAVLIPTLLYYGGGWLQYGYRYFLDRCRS